MRKDFIAPTIFAVGTILTAVTFCHRTVLLEHKDWAPDVKQGLNDLVTIYGNAPEKQYAVFDFDNTSSVFDITENEMCLQLMTMSFEMTPERFSEVMATGDFNFCTEFADTKLVVCFNRGNRKITDGGGLIAETAIYERDVLGYDLRKANEAGDILFLLQGRDDNGLRSLRPSNATLTLGATEEKLFAGPENWAQYRTMCDSSMTVKQIIEEFPIPFTEDYPGYRSIPSQL